MQAYHALQCLAVSPSGLQGGMAYHADAGSVREACKASETGTYPVRLASVGDRVEILFGRLEPAFFFYDGVTSDDDSQ